MHTPQKSRRVQQQGEGIVSSDFSRRNDGGAGASTSGEMSPTAARLVDLLRPHTPFCEAIVRRQAERAGLSVATLSEQDVAKLGPMILAAAAVFVDPAALATLRVQLKTR